MIVDSIEMNEMKRKHISSQVIPDDVQVDARLFAVRSAKHVCLIRSSSKSIDRSEIHLGFRSSLAISRT